MQHKANGMHTVNKRLKFHPFYRACGNLPLEKPRIASFRRSFFLADTQSLAMSSAHCALNINWHAGGKMLLTIKFNWEVNLFNYSFQWKAFALVARTRTVWVEHQCLEKRHGIHWIVSGLDSIQWIPCYPSWMANFESKCFICRNSLSTKQNASHPNCSECKLRPLSIGSVDSTLNWQDKIRSKKQTFVIRDCVLLFISLDQTDCLCTIPATQFECISFKTLCCKFLIKGSRWILKDWQSIIFD